MSVGVWTKQIVVLSLVVVFLAACTETTAPIVNEAKLPVLLVEGQGFWLPAGQQQPSPISGQIEIGWDDQVWASSEQGAVFQLADGSLVRMSPDARIGLRQQYADTQPAIQLLSGSIKVSAHSSGFLIETYRQVPLSLRIALVNMILQPKGASAEFELAFVENTAEASVSAGVVDVSTSEDSGTLQARWQAKLVPGESLEIIPPFDFTPTISPNATPTRTPTPTPTWTATMTATPTATATRRRTAIPQATATEVATLVSIPTDTPVPDDGGGEPKPPKPTPVPPTPVPPTPVPPTEVPPTPVPTERPTPIPPTP